MSVYEKDGNLHSHFNQQDYDACDEPARKAVAELYEQFGARVEDADGKSLGRVDYSAPDMVAILESGSRVYLEAEMKRDGWQYITGGAHFTIRKAKSILLVSKISPETVRFVMVNEDLTEALVVDGRYIYKAIQVLPEYAGFGNQPSSPNFKKPIHGCFPVRKKTVRDRSKAEDFISIAYKRASHWRRLDGVFVQIKRSDGEFLNDH